MLLELLQEDGLQPRRACSTNGGEYSSACPLCGGRDRFRVWPEKGRWWCRRCGNRGDVIQYLREVRGMSFAEAAERVGKKRDEKTFARARDAGFDRYRSAGFDRLSQRSRVAPELVEGKGSGDRATELVEGRMGREGNKVLWRSHAEDFVSASHETLLEYSGMMRWLANERGLDEVSVRAASLGWNQRDIRRDPKEWGLTERKKPLWLPRGLVIPVWSGGVLNRVKTRMDGRDPKYLTLAGGGSDPLVIPSAADYALIVESELDALLVAQVAGDLCTPIGLGSCTNRPDEDALALLKDAAIILDCLDTDDAGAAQAWKWWRERFPDTWVRWPCVGGKDPNAMRLAGEEVREWVRAGVERG